MNGPGGWTQEVAAYFDRVYLQPPDLLEDDNEIENFDEEYDRMKDEGEL